MTNFDPNAIKYITNSLQKQRNQAYDRLVDVEVAMAIEAIKFSEREQELQQELIAANATINSLRELLSQAVAKAEEFKDILEHASNRERGTFFVTNDFGKFVIHGVDDVIENTVSENLSGEVVVESVVSHEESTFENIDETVSDDAPSEDFENTNTENTKPKRNLKSMLKSPGISLKI